ncbi:ATP-binding protein [Xanthomonas sp. 60]
MRIERLVARNVHNRYNFDIEFNSDMTFLVGINGSGKTTALRLMQAVLTLDLYTLLSIRFSEIRVSVTDDSELSSVGVKSTGKHLSFLVNGMDVPFKASQLDDDKLNMYSKSDRIEAYVEDQRVELVHAVSTIHPRFLKSRRPLFLGLERRASRYENESFYYEDDASPRSFAMRKQVLGRGVQEGLDRCQVLVEQAYRKYRKVSDGAGGRLINIIVDSMFDYIEFDPESLVGRAQSAAEFQGLLDRRREIEALAMNLGGNRLAELQINRFFSKIQAVLEESNAGVNIEWLMNKSQILRIHKLLAEMDKQKKQAERFYEPVKNFLESINGFLRDSRKSVSVDSLGKLKVLQDGAEISLPNMSSGEKQLLILLAHAWFARSDKGVVIVDEPEISLHLRWQERLVDEISRGSGSQMIFATHSPEIVGFRKEKCALVG